MNFVDVKYIGLISARLSHFKKKTNELYNFRCPLCGDSEKNQYKARGYLYPSKDRTSFVYKCHNCGDTRSLANLIKFIDHTLYQKYLLDGFKKDERFVAKGQKEKKKTMKSFDFLEKKLGAVRLDHIPNNNSVYRFIKDRKIPDSVHERLYVIYDEKKLERVAPAYKGRIHGNDSRLLLPFCDRNGKLVGLAARATNPAATLRYLAFKIDDDAPMIFGLDHLKRNSREPIYVVEGPIDSLFLPNAIAVGGADFSKLSQEVRKDKCVIVFDNEPRNPEIVKRMKKIIAAEYKICIWSETIQEKDINDMILAGMDSVEITNVINKNTFSGLQATASLNKWKRCDV